ncbi:MAG TPA: NAD(P)/FAD-dependent oxidoreductase, partial [Verrucomicrobiae bacterium]
MDSKRIVIAGGGAAGFFAALACAEASPAAEIFILEKTAHFLSKVKISGGGRCNVTHAEFDSREFSKRYPRGERALISAFGKFQARDTVAWFESRGVKLKIESDGRMFPTTDSSQTIIDCLLQAGRRAGIKLKTNCSVESAV